MRLLSDEKINEIVREASRGAATRRDGTPSQRIARAIEAAVLEAQGKQEPVAWCVAYDDPRMGRIHSNPTMCEPEVDAHVSKCGGVVVKVPLFAAPVVQPDMVMVPREPTEAMLDAAMNRYKHVSPEAKARYTQMHRENFRCDYKAMIAAAEGKSNANVCGLPHGKESK